MVNILLIGCGKMGSALLDGWLENNVITSVKVVDPFLTDLQKSRNITKVEFYNNLNNINKFNLSENLSMIVLAVKPQIMRNILIDLKTNILISSPIMTIAAGLPISFYENILGEEISLFRTIPNTPSSILKGVTAICNNKNCTEEQKLIAQTLLKAVGKVVNIKKEDLMDSATAISGSGPAYIFYLLEALVAAGVSAGLDEKVSLKLAKSTLIGSSALLQKSEDDIATLRKAVTSPGGTTEAAIEVLSKNNNLFDLFEDAVIAARDRGRELALTKE